MNIATVSMRLIALLFALWAGIVHGLPGPVQYVNRPTLHPIEPRSQHEDRLSNETLPGSPYTPFISKTPAQLETFMETYEEAISQGAVSRMRKKMVEGTPIFVSNRGTGRHPNDWTTVITIINATPYRWRRGYIHSYQIDDWESDWPQYIEPGESFQTTNFRLNNGYYRQDTAGEVVYHLEGTWRPVSFMLQRRSGRRHHVWVKFLENLETDNLGRGSEIDLCFHPYPGGSQFILAGWEGEFIATEPPRGWMQNSLNDIGNYSLSEIVLPRSHHVGMSTDKVKFGFAVPKNTLTQTKSVSEQIENYGIRVLDLRVIKSNRKYYAGHGTMVMGAYNGMLGEKVEDIAKAIGKFHEKYPGELIIVDIPSSESAKIDMGWRQLNGLDIDKFYGFFRDYAKPMMKLPKGQDITRIPLNQLIGEKSKNRKGGTIIRVDRKWSLVPEFPGPEKGFVSSDDFPLNHRWSDKDRAERVAVDQVKALKENRPRRNSPLFFSDWIATQTTSQALLPEISITKMALPMYNVLYDDLWNATTDLTYPNWIAMDHIHAPELVSFVRVLNRCLVARRCGKLGGKVPTPANPIGKGRDAKYDQVMKHRESELKKKEQEEIEKQVLKQWAEDMKEEQRQEDIVKQREQKQKEEKERQEKEKEDKKKAKEEKKKNEKKKKKEEQRIKKEKKEEEKKRKEKDKEEKKKQKEKKKKEEEERREWEKKEKEARKKEKKMIEEKEKKEKEEAKIKKAQESEKKKVENEAEEEIQENRKERLDFMREETMRKLKEMDLEKEREEKERLEQIKNSEEKERKTLEKVTKQEEKEEFERIKKEMESK